MSELFRSEFRTGKGNRAVIRVKSSDQGAPEIEVTLPDQERPGPFIGALSRQSDGSMRFEAGTRRDMTRVTIPAIVATKLAVVLDADCDQRSASLRAEIAEGVARSARETVPDRTRELEEWLAGRGM